MNDQLSNKSGCDARILESYFSQCFSFVFLKQEILRKGIIKKFKGSRPSKESSLKVATTRAKLHEIQHKSIQVVAEGVGLENYH